MRLREQPRHSAYSCSAYPAVPIRQFVMSFPFELSMLAATKPEVLRALARIHAEELARYYKQAAKESGETGKPVADGNAAADADSIAGRRLHARAGGQRADVGGAGGGAGAAPPRPHLGSARARPGPRSPAA
jgi:hypothetical protein